MSDPRGSTEPWREGATRPTAWTSVNSQSTRLPFEAAVDQRRSTTNALVNQECPKLSTAVEHAQNVPLQRMTPGGARPLFRLWRRPDLGQGGGPGRSGPADAPSAERAVGRRRAVPDGNRIMVRGRVRAHGTAAIVLRLRCVVEGRRLSQVAEVGDRRDRKRRGGHGRGNLTPPQSGGMMGAGPGAATGGSERGGTVHPTLRRAPLTSG